MRTWASHMCYISHMERECWWGRIRVLPWHVILLFQFGEVKTFSLSWRTRHYGVWSHLLSRSGDESQHFKAKEDKEKSRLSKDLKKERNVSQWACLLYGDSRSFFPVFPKTENLKHCSDCIFNVWHCTMVVTAVLNCCFPLCNSTCLSWAFHVIVAEKRMSNKLLTWRAYKVFCTEQKWLTTSEIAVLLTVTLEDPQAW